jgi:hypothetical protein
MEGVGELLGKTKKIAPGKTKQNKFVQEGNF